MLGVPQDTSNPYYCQSSQREARSVVTGQHIFADIRRAIQVKQYRVPSLLQGGGKRNLSPSGNNSSPFRIFVVFSDDSSRAKDRHEKTNERTNERTKERKKERKAGKKKRRKETGQKRITFRRRTKCHSSEKFPWKSSICPLFSGDRCPLASKGTILIFASN